MWTWWRVRMGGVGRMEWLRSPAEFGGRKRWMNGCRWGAGGGGGRGRPATKAWRLRRSGRWGGAWQRLLRGSTVVRAQGRGRCRGGDRAYLPRPHRGGGWGWVIPDM